VPKAGRPAYIDTAWLCIADDTTVHLITTRANRIVMGCGSLTAVAAGTGIELDDLRDRAARPRRLLAIIGAAPPHPVVVVLNDGRVGEERVVMGAALGLCWAARHARVADHGGAAQRPGHEPPN
jgi:hypothetical protein